MGSSRPAEGLRNIRRTIKFARCQVKTVGMSLSLDAGRQLIDKGLRYLKTVRVTAAVYRGLAGFGQFNTPALGRHQELYKAFPPSSPLRFC